MKYVATAPVSMLPGALVRLTDEQLRRASALVKPAQEKGWFEVVITMQFKIGEAFEFDGELPKGMVDVVAKHQKEEPEPLFDKKGDPVIDEKGDFVKAPAHKPAKGKE
jgi:hypothetical protein